MQYFTSRKYIFIFFFSVYFFLSSLPPVSLASGGDAPGNWDPRYDPPSPLPESEPLTYGVWFCSLQLKVTRFLPTTSRNYWFSTLASKVVSDVPFLGGGILAQTLRNLKNVLVMVATWKVFKSLPGKF